MMGGGILLLGALLIGHAAADGTLQPGWLSSSKRRASGPAPRWLALGGHALLHGLVTGWLIAAAGHGAWCLLGTAEAVAHAAIDTLKADGRIGKWEDQGLHAACKLVWTAIVVVS